MPRAKLAKRQDGRFKCKYKDKQFYGSTQAEAFKKRDEYIALEESGYNPKMLGVNFREYSVEWIEVYHADCSNAQKKQYIHMAEFAADNIKRKLMKDITVTDMQSLCNRLSPYSPSHVSKFMCLLRGIFKTAVAEGVLIRNPMDTVKRPKTKKCEGHRALESWERALVASTCQEHEFGLAAMVMMLAGLRRGEALYIDIDRDVDFKKKTITVRGSVSWPEGNQPEITEGKTEAAQRVIPLFEPLEQALKGHHGLLCTKKDGKIMTEAAFRRKLDSYLLFLSERLNGCTRREYLKRADSGEEVQEWKEVSIRCHDFRVDFCTRAYEANIPVKTLQAWMGHADTTMIMEVYSKLTRERELSDAIKLGEFMNRSFASC